MPSCRPMQCEDPPIIPNGATEGCEDQEFGDLCLVTCNPGFFVNGTLDISAVTPCVGTDGTDPTIREVDKAGRPLNLAQYVNVPVCVPLICPHPHVANGKILTCPNHWEDECEITCDQGFSSKGLWVRSGQPIVFTCTDINRTGVFLTDDPTDACEELSCPVTPRQMEPNIGHLLEPAVGAYPLAGTYNCSIDQIMNPGEICLMTCRAGYQLPDDVIYLGCRLGQYVGYTSADMNLTKILTAPTCRPYGSDATEVTVVESQLRLALGYADDVQKLTEPSAKKPVGEGIKRSFVVVAEDPLNDGPFNAEFTVHVKNINSLDMNSRRLDEDDFDDEDGWARFLKKHALDETSTNAPTTTAAPTDDPYEALNASRLGKVRGRASVIVLFSVAADGGQAGHALDFAKGLLDEWSSSPGTVPMSVYDSMNAALEEAGIMVTIVGLAFTAPTMGLKVVESEIPPVVEPIDIQYWLTVSAFGALGCVVLAFLRSRIKKWLKARRRKREKLKHLYGPRTQQQISVEQEKLLMQQYGMRPPIQQAAMMTQTEPWAYPTPAAQQMGHPTYGAAGPPAGPGVGPPGPGATSY